MIETTTSRLQFVYWRSGISPERAPQGLPLISAGLRTRNKKMRTFFYVSEGDIRGSILRRQKPEVRSKKS